MISMPTKDQPLSATDRARLVQMRKEVRDILNLADFTADLFTASATAFRERTGMELNAADPAVHLSDQDKLRALELFAALRSRAGKV
jgi:hypothetical protein